MERKSYLDKKGRIVYDFLHGDSELSREGLLVTINIRACTSLGPGIVIEGSRRSLKEVKWKKVRRRK